MPVLGTISYRSGGEIPKASKGFSVAPEAIRRAVFDVGENALVRQRLSIRLNIERQNAERPVRPVRAAGVAM
jgi:hypothetical protein